MRNRLKLGTRGSPLALWQAHWVRDELQRCHPDLSVDVVIIRTRADRFPEQPLHAIGTGIFTREIDDALLDGEVDLAVHSLKDIPSEMPARLRLAAVPPRESPLDAFVSTDGTPLDALPAGVRIGTGSPRRKAQLLAHRADLDIVPLRGNVDTRLRKLSAERLAGTVLAHAGLKRLGREEVITEILEPRVLLPAVGQGALAVCCRFDDEEWLRLLEPIDDRGSHLRILSERAFLRRLRGGCQIPAGALATVDATPGSDLEGISLRLDAVLASPDGSTCLRGSRNGPAGNAETMGQELADELLAAGGEKILLQVRTQEP